MNEPSPAGKALVTMLHHLCMIERMSIDPGAVKAATKAIEDATNLDERLKDIASRYREQFAKMERPT